jgi:hypothetical protein
MKKKSTKLSQRFDSLREQINARILDDQYHRKMETAGNYYLSHHWPPKG